MEFKKYSSYNKHKDMSLIQERRRAKLNIYTSNSLAERILTCGGGVELSNSKSLALNCNISDQECSDQVIKNPRHTVLDTVSQGLTYLLQANAIAHQVRNDAVYYRHPVLDTGSQDLTYLLQANAIAHQVRNDVLISHCIQDKYKEVES